MEEIIKHKGEKFQLIKITTQLKDGTMNCEKCDFYNDIICLTKGLYCENNKIYKNIKKLRDKKINEILNEE
jgi:hypothetical protein